MTVALYTRVSTTDQSTDGQLIELRQYCRQRGWTIAHEFSDTISGTTGSREGLDRMMELVRNRQIEAVVAVKLDRIARSIVHFATIASTLVKYDVAMVLTTQGIDTSKSNPCGKFQQNILACVAEFEKDLISERTKAGLAATRAKGTMLGRPSKLMPPTNEARTLIVVQWLDEQMPGGYAELGRRLGGVSPATAWRLVKKTPRPTPTMEID